jgi:NAD(P)-dependent dehydrogenase (short-subunit alcohol dehydrogenase family)
VLDICKKGGYAAILDMNSELGDALVKELGASARFFQCDVSDTDSIAAAVKDLTAWTQEAGKPLGGIIPAAGVGRPGLVCLFSPLQYRCTSCIPTPRRFSTRTSTPCPSTPWTSY